MSWDNLLRVVALVIGCAGLWIIAMNFACIYAGVVRRCHRSVTPLLGGIGVTSALLICPLNGAIGYAWIPLLVDPGCLLSALMLAYSAFILRAFRR